MASPVAAKVGPTYTFSHRQSILYPKDRLRSHVAKTGLEFSCSILSQDDQQALEPMITIHASSGKASMALRLSENE